MKEFFLRIKFAFQLAFKRDADELRKLSKITPSTVEAYKEEIRRFRVNKMALMNFKHKVADYFAYRNLYESCSDKRERKALEYRKQMQECENIINDFRMPYDTEVPDFLRENQG